MPRYNLHSVMVVHWRSRRLSHFAGAVLAGSHLNPL
nr:MAG TPA: hypothetical protein [Caudoviricetes sp.]